MLRNQAFYKLEDIFKDFWNFEITDKVNNIHCCLASQEGEEFSEEIQTLKQGGKN